MAKVKSASKIKIDSFDDLFGSSVNSVKADSDLSEQVVEVCIKDLHTFKNHPFRVLDDEKMEETVESIKKYGVLMPGIARPRKEGGYEIIAGYRRKRGCELAGKTTMPASKLKEYAKRGELTQVVVELLLSEQKVLECKVTIKAEKLRSYFPKDYSNEDMEAVIIKLLDEWKRKQKED